MTDPSLRLAAGLIALALLAPPARAELPPLGPGGPARTPSPKADDARDLPVVRIDWRTDLAAATREAARTERPLLLFFHADWCQPCRLMDQGTFASRPIAQYIGENFIPVRIDDSKETSQTSRRFQIRLYPTLLFLTTGGEPMHIVLGAVTAAQLHPMMQRIRLLPRLREAYQRTPDDLETNYALGATYAALDQYKKAEPYLKRAADLDTGNAHGRRSRALLVLAVVPLEDGDSAAALRNLERYAKDFPDDAERPTALYYVGAILLQDGRLEDARRAFDRVRTEYPKHVKAYEADKAIDAIDARLEAQKREKTPAKAPAKPASPPRPASPPKPKG